MTDRKLEQIERRIADTLEEIRILRADGNQQAVDARARDQELFAEMRAARTASEQHADELFTEMRALRDTSDLQTAELRHQSQELRRVSDTNQLHTDALRALLERDDRP